MEAVVTSTRKLEKLALLEEKKKLINGLPHLHGMKFYSWAREFFESKNKVCILVAGNQLSKSSTQIRKIIHLATEPKAWKEYWPHMHNPRQFWYLYPSSFISTIEFEKKWVPEWLPRDEFKNHPQYGWEAEYRAKYIQAIHFNTGVSVYFKTYSQDPADLQSGSCAYIACDEEVDDSLMPELQARLFSTDGFFSIAMTPTKGLEFWREAVEVRGHRERFPNALKQQISMYDCLVYEDGTNSHWTVERIGRIKQGCKSQAEIDRRVYGKFCLDEGLKYPSFNPAVNIIDPIKLDPTWPVYIGVDSGAGGKYNHPSAIAAVAMRPDYRLGYVFKGRRLDGMETTADTLVSIVNELISEIKNPIYGVYYDFAAHDLKTISASMGASWLPAEKSHAIGEQVINVGFKNRMLQIFGIDELAPLVNELKTLKLSTSKNVAVDHLIDAMRYAITRIPWDWSAINEQPTAPEKVKDEVQLRRDFHMQSEPDGYNTLEQEIEAFNELLAVDTDDYYE